MRIDRFDTQKEVFLIAEIGNNHEGSRALAEELIGLAAKAGANAVKFQTIIPDRLVSRKETQRIEQLNRLCLKYDDFVHLEKVARRENVLFMSTPFDADSAAFLDPLVPAFKIASCDNDYFQLIRAVCKTGKPIIASSGLARMNELVKLRDFVLNEWKAQNIVQDLAILHCVSQYPVAPDNANLLAIPKLQQLGVTVGYSDHVIGLDAAIAAVTLGARIIEKHFTIRKDYSSFRDHQLSADPADLKLLVEKIRGVERLLGTGEIDLKLSENDARKVMRRGPVAKKNLTQGHVLTAHDIAWVRPQGAFAPEDEKLLIGKKIKTSIEEGVALSPDNLEEKK